MIISPKLKDLVKRGACTVLTSVLIAIPSFGKGETKVEKGVNETKIVQEYKQEIEIDSSDLDNPQRMIELAIQLVDSPQDVSNYPTFVLVTHWERTSNYESNNKYSNGHREYKRTIYRFRANEKFNNEYFDNNIEKIAKFFRDKSNSSDIFDILDTYEQVVTFTAEEEKKLNLKEDIVEIEGTNIIFKIDSKEVDQANTIKAVVKLVGLLLMFLSYGGIMISKSNRRF